MPAIPPSDVQVLPDPAMRWLEKQQGWKPATIAQKAALDSDADILLLGGAAGSLKTSSMLVDLIQEREWPRMRSYFFRKTYKELEGGDSAIDQSLQLFQRAFCELFPNTSATYNASSHTWRWPSGAEFYFRHCQHKDDVYSYQGHAMSAGAIDESTHWEEKEVRYLISRNRSTDPGMKVRWRLGTNPGNIGHKWHMKLFFPDMRVYPSQMLGVCPHCEPQNAPQQGKLRWDARWPSDGQPLEDPETQQKLSVSFILSYVRDHNLLGPAYVARLRMQSPATAKALLEGCWRIFEGQYFDCWDYERMTLPRQAVKDEWWWAHWTGSDYGYAGSAAASLEFTKSPEGDIYVLDEYPSGDIQGARREDVRTFAKNHYKRLVEFHKDSHYDQPKRIETMYLGRDSWAERGDLHTLGDQMNDVLAEYDLSFAPIGDDRAGGAQLWYTMLANGGIRVCRNCRNLIEAIESRLHDPDEPMKTLKAPGDPLDDYMDAGFHGLYGHVQAEGKPKHIENQEKFQKIYQRDATTAMVQWHRMARESEEDEEPVYLSSRAKRLKERLQTKR